jgi:hypothetical protein
MLPDLRFVFGAALALAMLGTAGFGLAISVRLLHDAGMASLEPTQSLAYAAPAQENPFRDIDSAPRFAGAAGRPEEHAEVEAAPPAASESRVKPDEPAAASPPEHAEEEPTAEKPAEAAPARTAEAAPAEPTATAGESKIAPGDAAAEAARTSAAPADPERLTTAPAVAPTAESRRDKDPPAQLETNLHAAQNPAAATTPARRLHRKPHSRLARVQRPAPAEQSSQTWSFPTSSTQWPSYNDQWGTTPTTQWATAPETKKR